jgi:hypothetical protein
VTQEVTNVTPLTQKDVTTMLGPLDDVTVATIIATGATADELAQAQAWLCNDEALINAGKPLPAGRVGELVEIVAMIEEEDEADPARPS